MQEMSIPQLVKYLVDGDDFVNIADTIFHEYVGITAVDELFLMQISKDGRSLDRIAGVLADKDKTPVLTKYALEKAEFLNDEIQYISVSEFECNKNEGTLLFIPVYIREKTAMYVCAYKEHDTFIPLQVEKVSQITLIIQSIATRKNFEDSLENSYRLLEELLDEIPTGVAVLDNDRQNVLLMNKIAAESPSVQNAIGLGLVQFLESGESTITEIFENEYGSWYDVQFTEIEWINGEKVLLCTVIDVTQKVKNQQRIEYQANNDYLTGLFNRMKCERDLKEIVSKSIEDEKME